MKIKIIVLLLFVSAVSSIVSCGTDKVSAVTVPAHELVAAAVAGYNAADVPDSLLFIYGAEAGGDNYLDSDTAGLYFKGEFAADMSELNSLADYAIHMPNTKRVFEIDVFVSKTAEGLATAKGLLESRLEQKNNGDIQSYTPEEVPLLDSAEIYIRGSCAILLATPDNTIARGIIDGMIKTEAVSTDAETAAETAAVPEGNENEFKSIIEADIGITETETSEDDTAPRSEIPDISVVKHNENYRVLIGGKCAEDAVIHMRGGVTDLIYKPDSGYFLGNIEIPSSGSATVYVTAEQPSLAESEPYIIHVTARTDMNLEERMGAYHRIIGGDYQGFVVDELNDRTGANVLSDKQVKAAENKIADRVNFLNGLDCKLIYFIIPTPMHVYPELVPDRIPLNTGITRTEQFETAAAQAGAVVINLYDLFTEHKNDEYKIYHKTDTHWTQYGAYLGYCELMKYISAAWPDAVARSRDEVEFYKKEVLLGDMAPQIDIGTDTPLRENATFMRLLFDTEFDNKLFSPGTNCLNHDLISSARITRNDRADKSLPRAYILRDSFGSPIYALVSDAFESTSWRSMWNYDFNKKDISAFDPDYLIYIITERNIGSVIG
ncbi:MAG: alginate O-acetyltransferase AlgX-related protein [Eubacteriales bacterium]